MLFKKKKQHVRIVRIAEQEWTDYDASVAKQFFKCETFGRVKAFCDGVLIKLMLSGHADESYRKGWLDCQRQYAQFANVEDSIDDSMETTSMQDDYT